MSLLPHHHLKLTEIATVLGETKELSTCCTSSKVNRFGLSATYCPGGQWNTMLLNLQTDKKQSYFKDYNHLAIPKFLIANSSNDLVITPGSLYNYTQCYIANVSEDGGYEYFNFDLDTDYEMSNVNDGRFWPRVCDYEPINDVLYIGMTGGKVKICEPLTNRNKTLVIHNISLNKGYIQFVKVTNSWVIIATKSIDTGQYIEYGYIYILPKLSYDSLTNPLFPNVLSPHLYAYFLWDTNANDNVLDIVEKSPYNLLILAERGRMYDVNFSAGYNNMSEELFYDADRELDVLAYGDQVCVGLARSDYDYSKWFNLPIPPYPSTISNVAYFNTGEQPQYYHAYWGGEGYDFFINCSTGYPDENDYNTLNTNFFAVRDAQSPVTPIFDGDLHSPYEPHLWYDTDQQEWITINIPNIKYIRRTINKTSPSFLGLNTSRKISYMQEGSLGTWVEQNNPTLPTTFNTNSLVFSRYTGFNL